MRVCVWWRQTKRLLFCNAWANDGIIRLWRVCVCVCVYAGVYRDILRVVDGGSTVSRLWNDSMERQTNSPALNLPSGSALRARITCVSVSVLWVGMRACLRPLTLHLTVIILSCQFFFFLHAVEVICLFLEKHFTTAGPPALSVSRRFEALQSLLIFIPLTLMDA